VPPNAPKRCGWVPLSDPLYVAYHDEEWGVPSHDEQYLFEMVVLEGAQAGLSWSTILHKRQGYQKAFVGFDPEAVARFNARTIERLLKDPSIVRNRLKVESAVANGRAILALHEKGVTLDELVWSFVDGEPLLGRRRKVADIPAETDVSRAMSKELKRNGFRFVGPTTCYSFMQGAGLVDDHVTSCFRYGAGVERAPSKKTK
jgi:DNA-3-methyladenine glycosylase I